MGELMETILHRRAIRRYETRQIAEDALQQILQAGLYAPSAGGRQGPLLVVSQDRTVNQRLGRIKRANSHPRMATATSYVSKEQPSIADDPRLTDAFYGAPTVITLFGPKGFLFTPEDCAVAAENMMLAAHCLGLGSVWVNRELEIFDSDAGKALLKEWNLPQTLRGVGAIALGWPAGPAPEPAPRKDGYIVRV